LKCLSFLVDNEGVKCIFMLLPYEVKHTTKPSLRLRDSILLLFCECWLFMCFFKDGMGSRFETLRARLKCERSDMIKVKLLKCSHLTCCWFSSFLLDCDPIYRSSFEHSSFLLFCYIRCVLFSFISIRTSCGFFNHYIALLVFVGSLLLKFNLMWRLFNKKRCTLDSAFKCNLGRIVAFLLAWTSQIRSHSFIL